MRFAILTFVALLVAQLAKGQIFEKGYLVLQSGDTLRGEVENAFWTEPPKMVRFRSLASVAPVRYAAEQLQIVALASGRLIRHELLPLDRTAEVNIDYLTTSKESHQRPDSVMADVLATGTVSLLAVSLNGNQHFFLRRVGQPWLELAGRNYLVYGQGLARVADANNYKGQLSLYFIDCPPLTRQLEALPFTVEAMRHLVEAYNRGCSEEAVGREPTRPDNRPAATLRMGLLFGVRFNSLLLSPDGAIKELNGLDLDGRPHVQGGGYLNLMSPGRRLALHIGLQTSGVGRSEPAPFAATFANKAGTFEWHGALVALQFGLRHFVALGNNQQLFLGTGYEFNTFWNLTSELTYDEEVGPFASRFYGTPLPYVEVGVNRDRLALSVNGRLYGGDVVAVPNTASYSYYPWSVSLTMGYRLNADTDAAVPTAPR